MKDRVEGIFQPMDHDMTMRDMWPSLLPLIDTDTASLITQRIFDGFSERVMLNGPLVKDYDHMHPLQEGRLVEE